MDIAYVVAYHRQCSLTNLSPRKGTQEESGGTAFSGNDSAKQWNSLNGMFI